MTIATLVSTADTYVSSSSGTTSYSGNAYVLHGGTFISYLNFDLSAIPQGSTITSASLSTIGVNNSNAAGTIDVYRVTSAWNESGLTYNTRPTISLVQDNTTYPVSSTSAWATTDLTAAIQSLVDLAPSARYGVALISSVSGRNFVSKEDATANRRPTLTVDYVAAVQTVDVNVPAGTGANASTLALDPAVQISPAANTNVTKNPTADATSNGPLTSTTSTTLPFGNFSNPVFKFDLAELAGRSVDSAVFSFTAGNAVTTYEVRPIDTAWTEASGSLTIGTTSYGNSTAGNGLNTVDISALVREWANGTRTNNGFALVTSGGTVNNVTSRESATNKPSLAVAYYVPGTDASVTATPATASATLVEPVVTTVDNNSYLATPATATALMTETAVTAITNPNAEVAVTPATASADMPGGSYSAPTIVPVDSAVASAFIVEPAFYSDNNAVIQVSPMTAFATVVPVAEAEEIGYGLYAQRIDSQSDDSDIWLRLDETSGTVANNEMPVRGDATYVGTPIFGGFGLENRRVIGFSGDDYVALPDTGAGARNGTLEVVFRTSQATGSLMYGIDNAVPSTAGSFVGADFITSVSLTGGKIAVAFTDGTTFTGTKVVSDGAWHHVVVTWVGTRLTVYLDGKLHFARHLLEGQNIVAIPDTIGVGFKGDIMEFVFHDGNVLTEADTIGNYYSAFGIVPVQVEVATATAVMTTGSKGKGNRKRALGLYFDATPDRINDQWDDYDWTGLSTSGLTFNAYGQPVPFDMGEYMVFPKSIARDENLGTSAYLGGLYYDEITGEPRYLDLANDLDASEYDLVFFINLPPRFNTGAGYGNEPSYVSRLYEDLINGVRKAQDEGGFSLWVPQPDLAVALGVIDRVEAHSMMRESLVTSDQGNALTLYDARSAQVNPWDGNPANGRYYYDNHALNRYRVAANVEGLTDLGGFIDEDMFYGRPRNPFELSFTGWKVRELTNGLQIGDEFMYGTQDEYDGRRTGNVLGTALDRYSVVAVPPTSVKAGTVVTRENAKHYLGTTQVDNPYKDYATSIVLEPGDSLAGRPVGGRIFVNFMEGAEALGWTTYTKQVVHEVIADPNAQEDADKRAWTYSTYRLSTNSSAIVSPNEGGNADIVRAYSEYEKYPTISLRRYGMLERAFNWLAKRVVVAQGEKVIRPAAATATATMISPVVRAEKDAEFNVQPALATATIVKPANVAAPDVSVNVLPMTARADITGYGKAIAVGPATAFAEMVENFDIVYAGGERIVLTLHHVDATLYLLEEA